MTNNDKMFFKNQKPVYPIGHCEAFVERKWELSRKQTFALQNKSINESYDESFGLCKVMK